MDGLIDWTGGREIYPMLTISVVLHSANYCARQDKMLTASLNNQTQFDSILFMFTCPYSGSGLHKLMDESNYCTCSKTNAKFEVTNCMVERSKLSS